MKSFLIGLPAVALAVVLLFVVETRLLAAPGTVYTAARARRHDPPATVMGRADDVVRACAFPLGMSCPPSIPGWTNVLLMSSACDASVVLLAAQAG